MLHQHHMLPKLSFIIALNPRTCHLLLEMTNINNPLLPPKNKINATQMRVLQKQQQRLH